MNQTTAPRHAPVVPKQKNELRWGLHQKRWFGKWHLYIGIIAGAILCVVGLTGSILVFQDEIDIALNKELFIALEGKKRFALEEVVPLVQERYPHLVFDYVMMGDEHNPNATYRFFNLKTEEEFFVNPYTAELSGKRIHESSFVHVVTELHRNLLFGEWGRYIVGIATLCMLILTISGLRLWVPQQYRKWKQWKAVLTVNFKASFKRQNYDWHNVLGLYSAPVIVLLSLTGFAITFSGVFIGALFLLAGQSPQSVASIFAQKSVYTEGAKTISVKEAADIAAVQFPGTKLMGVSLPTAKDMVYRLDIKSDGPAKSGNRILLMLDQYSGRVVLNSETDFPNIGNSYLTWLVPIHYGTFGGMPTRILAFIGGLIPLLLYITGFVIWWPRYKKQAAKETYVAPKSTLKEKELAAVRALPFGRYFGYYFKKGVWYAALLLASAFLSGALYGVVSGIVVQPALFAVLYTGICVCVNFVVALLVMVLSALFLVPFRRPVKSPTKYFSLSLAFMLLFLPACLAIAWFSKDVF